MLVRQLLAAAASSEEAEAEVRVSPAPLVLPCIFAAG